MKLVRKLWFQIIVIISLICLIIEAILARKKRNNLDAFTQAICDAEKDAYGKLYNDISKSILKGYNDTNRALYGISTLVGYISNKLDIPNEETDRIIIEGAKSYHDVKSE